METKQILETAVKALDKKKAKELSAIKVADLTVLTEYFVIATATSSTHVRALADEVEDALADAGLEPHHIEGRTTGWIVIDYASVIVHIFSRDQREFYGLDKMWSDGEPIDLSSIIDVDTEDNDEK